MTTQRDEWLEKIAKELGFIGRVAANGDGGFEDMDAIGRSVQIAVEALDAYELNVVLAAEDLPQAA